MDRRKSCRNDLFAAENVMQIRLGVMGAGIAITFVIDGFKGAAVDGIGQIISPHHCVDGRGPSNARCQDAVKGIDAIFDSDEEVFRSPDSK